jgi:hypothetical protein
MNFFSRSGEFIIADVSLIVTAVAVFARPSKILGIVLFVIACVFALFLTASKIIMSFYIKVPDIEQLPVDVAYRLLKDNGLKFHTEFDRDNHEKIIKQTPVKNTYVRKKNNIVTVVTHDEEVDRLRPFFDKALFVALNIPKPYKYGGLLNGRFENTYEDGSKYSGEYRDGIPNGKGVFEKEVFKYEGGFLDALPHGKGKIEVLADDDGHGIKAGVSYDGDWFNGKMHGKGVYTFASGAKYEGDWVDDKRHGKGVYTYADGSYNVGTWKNGEADGMFLCYDA